MNQINHTLQTLLIMALFAMMLAGCKKFVGIDEPIDKITTTNVFSNNQSAISALTGVYSQMMIVLPQMFSGGVTINAGLTADELTYTGTAADIVSVNENNIQSNNSIMQNDLWTKAYGIIYHINASLEGLEKSTAVTDSVKKQLTGELYFLRAYSYFYLVNLFGDVPLVLTTDAKLNATLPRTPATDVFMQIQSDLTGAISLMSASYPTTGRVRANKWAARALQARIYLHQQDWSKAEQAATDVIASGMYTIVTNLNNVFLATSNEAIWQLAPTSTIMNTVEGNRFIPASTLVRPTYTISAQLLAAIEPGDQRKMSWMKNSTVSSIVYWYPYKYKVRTATTVTENYMMLRLAEMVLVRSEARAKQDKINDAKSDLNTIRSRAGLPNTTANDKPTLLAALEHERRIELFAEWGHRWFDLKRWNRANTVLAFKPGWQATDILFPIPFNELLQNSALVQNPGY